MIEKTLVPDAEQPGFLSAHLGSHHELFEILVYASLDHFCDSTGGDWTFYRLSNGSFFMAPDSREPYRVLSDPNTCGELLSAEAAGIGVTLHTLNVLSIETGDEALATLFRALRKFAGDHPEAPSILSLID